MRHAPIVVSILVVAGFLAVVFIWLVRPLQSQSEGVLTVVNILVGSLGTAFSQTVQYWLGSSAGSKNKDEIIKQASGQG